MATIDATAVGLGEVRDDPTRQGRSPLVQANPNAL